MSVGVWRYSEPGNGYEGWWIAFLDDAGCLSVQSDFGDYSYRWNMRGMPERDGKLIGLREFLLTTGADYVLGKFATRSEFDDEGSLKAVRKEILDRRRAGECDADWARSEWDIATEHLDGTRSGDDWIRETAIDEPWFLLGNRYPQQATAFMDRIWPRIVAAIRADLQQPLAVEAAQ